MQISLLNWYKLRLIFDTDIWEGVVYSVKASGDSVQFNINKFGGDTNTHH